ncbi:MAG: tRNA-specific adenosine deaminase [Phycisphaerae bacterium]|nr:tRNA-specific adenosine deaminase [Phycisphaerae bacterium]
MAINKSTIAKDGGPELVLGLIGAVGTDLDQVRKILEERLQVFGYSVDYIHITKDVIPRIVDVKWKKRDEYDRLVALMNAGDKARKKFKNNAILAIGAAAVIHSKRKKGGPNQAHAYIISSLKHPDEVDKLRAVYPQGFYLIGVHSDEDIRRKRLLEDKRITASESIDHLFCRDQDGQLEYGQRVTDTFHLADFFVRFDGDVESVKYSLWRVLDLLFGNPHLTPTFDEFAMYMAFSASLHSADLSRQVGAVICKNESILATGANDVPRAGGGQYWSDNKTWEQTPDIHNDGRDFVIGCDPNKIEQQRMINEIVAEGVNQKLNREKLRKVLEKCRIRDLTEFGRVMHAEMDTLLSCARSGISIQNSELYVTTFPCHNCAKHIVAAGVKRVVFIEPYPKSKALQLHKDSIQLGFHVGSTQQKNNTLVQFEPFVGVGPRQFFDLFSMRLGSGYPLIRKEQNGKIKAWKQEDGKLRLRMLPITYLDLELEASSQFLDVIN